MNDQVSVEREVSRILSQLSLAGTRLQIAATLMDVVRCCSSVPSVSFAVTNVSTVNLAFDTFHSKVEDKSRALLTERFAKLHDQICDADFDEAEKSSALLHQDLHFLSVDAPLAVSEAQVELGHVLATISRRRYPQPRPRG